MSTPLRVLLVEDSPDDATLVLRELQRAGFAPTHERVETVEGMQAALRKPWDIVLADYRLPHFGGLAALAEVKASGLDLPFIIVSGAIGEDVAVAVMKAGAHDYLMKDKLARLGPAVRRELSETDGRRQQRQAQAAVAAGDARYRMLFEHSPHPIWIEDFSAVKAVFDRLRHEGVTDFQAYFEQHPEAVTECAAKVKIVEMSEETLRLFGVTRKEQIPTDLPSFFCEDSWPAFRDELVTLAAGDMRYESEISIRALNGELKTIALRLSVPPESRDTLSWVLVTFTDITHRRQLEEQFRQVQKMEAVGRLAGGIAHDFNNILQAILGYTELLIKQVGQENPWQQDLGEVREAARRAQTLTQQLLAFSRKQMIAPRVLELNSLVESAGKMLRRLVGEDITLTTLPEPELWRVKADPGQIEQVIVNLVVNARDAMPGGGTITLRTQNVTLAPEDAASVPESREGRFVCLAVTDTGVGMSPEVLRHIFEPFFTTKGVGKGTGLGLAMIYGTAKQHEGWMNVYSQEGQGSCFKLYLPVLSAADEAGTGASVPTDTVRLSGKGERILLVEDDPGVRALSMRILTGKGYVVWVAATAAQALDIVDRTGEEFDLLFSDVVLPDRNGVSLAEEILRRKPAMRVIMTSGYSDERSRWPIIREKGFCFLQKPYPAAELLRVIREVLI